MVPFAVAGTVLGIGLVIAFNSGAGRERRRRRLSSECAVSSR